MSSAYDNCIGAFKGKMEEKRIPLQELGFVLASAQEVLVGHR